MGLSSYDKAEIAHDKLIRLTERYLLYPWEFQTTRRNEYLEFLHKCEDHAAVVGDDDIWKKIHNEQGKWKEVEGVEIK